MFNTVLVVFISWLGFRVHLNSIGTVAIQVVGDHLSFTLDVDRTPARHRIALGLENLPHFLRHLFLHMETNKKDMINSLHAPGTLYWFTWILSRTPVESILLATLTALPQISYWGLRAPITPATTGPMLIPARHE